MKRSDDDQEWVLDTCPQLVSLEISIMGLKDTMRRWEPENDGDFDGIIRSITLDLPSLETLRIGPARTVKKCTLTCPKLVGISIGHCSRMVALKFDGGPQLHYLSSELRQPSECHADHKKQVTECVFVFVVCCSPPVLEG